MKNFYENYIERLIRDYFDSTKVNNFSILSSENNLEFDSYGDFLLYFEEKLVGIIEVKRNGLLNNIKKKQIQRWSELGHSFELYILISENNSIVLNNELLVIGEFYDSLIDVLEFISDYYQGNKYNYNAINDKKKHEVYRQITSYLTNLLVKYVDDIEKRAEDRIFTCDFSKNEVTFTENFEMNLFDKLLQTPNKEKRFFRYTSLDSAFITINSKKFIFSGIVGMNDTTEVDYVETYLFNRTIEDHKKHWTQIDKLNRKYIMSCTSLRDNLTFWRLYGDDFKGVQFDLELKEYSNKYIIKEVHYADNNGHDDVLDLIKDISSYLMKTFGLKLVIKNFETWKHFFKPHEYSVEKEVRILYLGDDHYDDRKWNLTYSHKIINPFVLVDMDNSPLKLKKIVLGRKTYPYSTNEFQFQQLLRERNLNKEIDVEISKIVNYR